MFNNINLRHWEAYVLGDRESLIEIVQRKLEMHGILSATQEITLQPCHTVVVGGKQYSHFIISCLESGQKLFLKVLKENDCTLHCNKYLQKIRDKNGRCPYPLILIPNIFFHGVQYYITTFVNGQTLDELSKVLPADFWDGIADQLLLRYDELGTIRAPLYSEHGSFIAGGYATIFTRKLAEKLHYPGIPLSMKKRNRAFEWCSEILETSSFSAPVLLHMDIKPANIIYEPHGNTVSLIDFEFARFGDADYGWTQLLLSGLNNFSDIYKHRIVPRMTRNRLTIRDALDIPKYQCYLFYQLICNFMYYDQRDMRSPEEMTSLFAQLVARIR